MHSYCAYYARFHLKSTFGSTWTEDYNKFHSLHDINATVSEALCSVQGQPVRATVVSGSPEVRKVTLHLSRAETLTGRTGFAFIFFQLTRACGMCDTACLFISLSAVFGRRLKLNTLRLRKENGGEASFTWNSLCFFVYITKLSELHKLAGVPSLLCEADHLRPLSSLWTRETSYFIGSHVPYTPSCRDI